MLKILSENYMNKFRDISAYFVVGLGLCSMSYLLQSSFLLDFLRNNLISLIATLLAINIANSTLLLSKLENIVSQADNPNISSSFTKTTKEIYINLRDQVLLILGAIFFLSLENSKYIIGYPCALFWVRSCIVAVLAYAIDILWDTAKAVIIILNYRKK